MTKKLITLMILSLCSQLSFAQTEGSPPTVKTYESNGYTAKIINMGEFKPYVYFRVENAYKKASEESANKKTKKLLPNKYYIALNKEGYILLESSELEATPPDRAVVKISKFSKDQHLTTILCSSTKGDFYQTLSSTECKKALTNQGMSIPTNKYFPFTPQ